eukprot:m.65517 g.65517  ORF g.65517 m.65517 type:complete len:115 (+) comp19639_c0_seq1:1136-1480(+)
MIAGHRSPAAVVVDDIIYLCCGHVNDLERLNTSNPKGQWQKLKPYTGSYRAHAALVHVEGYLYVFGGTTNTGGVFRPSLRYHIDSDSWNEQIVPQRGSANSGVSASAQVVNWPV